MNGYPLQQESTTKPLKALVIEPDPPARMEMERLLGQDQDLQISGSYGTGFEALVALKQETPDLLIAGVPLPGVDLFRSLNQMDQSMIPGIIVVASDTSFATQAIEVSAADYLVKPFDPHRFARALNRGKVRVAQQRSFEQENGSLSFCAHKLALGTRRSVLFLNEEELDWAEAYGKHVRLHCGTESLLLRMSITALETILKPLNFIRIHRSVIVNEDRIRWLHRAPNRKHHQIVLKNGTSLIVTRKDALNSLLALGKQAQS